MLVDKNLNEKTIEGLKCPIKRCISPVKRLSEYEKNNNSVLNLNCFEKQKIHYGWYKRNIVDESKFIKENITSLIGLNSKYILNDLIEKVKLWYQGSFVFISAGTGTGKTTFMEWVCNNIPCTALILTNRIANKLQIEKHLSDNCYNPNIFIKSYQEIETNNLLDKEWLENFNYIFMDESHYFISDSNFNTFANVSYEKIISTRKPTKIFLSATNEEIVDKVLFDLLAVYNFSHMQLLQCVKIYNSVYNASYIKSIYSFLDHEDLVSKIIGSKQKWMIFVKSIDEGNKLLNELKRKSHGTMNCEFISRDILNEGKSKINNLLNKIIIKEKFEEDVLITTSLLDNGVNIKDIKLKNIALFESDFTEIIQMIGRKRCIDEKDVFNLYLINESKKSLSVQAYNHMKHIKKIYEVRGELQISRDINPLAIRSGKESDEYRQCIYKNSYTKMIDYNKLGLVKSYNSIVNLKRLKKSSSPFEEKASWVNSKLKYKAAVIDDRSNLFIFKIQSFLNKKLSNKDRDSRIYISNVYMEIYGKESSSEKKNRPFTLDKLRLKFKDKKIPIEIEILNKEFILKYSMDLHSI